MTVFTITLLIALSTAAPLPCRVFQGLENDIHARTTSDLRLATMLIKAMENQVEWIESQNLDNDIPMAEQFTAEQSATFSRLTASSKAALLNRLIESRRIRDLQLIAEMAHLSEREAKWSLNGIGKDEYKLQAYAALTVLREHLEYDISESGDIATTDCTLERALYEEQLSALDEALAIAPDDFIAEIDALRERYRTNDLDSADMYPQDADRWRELRPRARQMVSIVQHINDLGRLRLLESFSRRYRELTQQDILEHGSEIEHFGRTFDAATSAGNLSERDKWLEGFWLRINETIPADINNELSQD